MKARFIVTFSEAKSYILQCMIENISIDNLKFVGTHASNYLPMTGTLQKDRNAMLTKINSGYP